MSTFDAFIDRLFRTSYEVTIYMVSGNVVKLDMYEFELKRTGSCIDTMTWESVVEQLVYINPAQIECITSYPKRKKLW